MLNSCGLKAWACNSQVVHSTSSSLKQRFVRVGPVNFVRGDEHGQVKHAQELSRAFSEEATPVATVTAAPLTPNATSTGNPVQRRFAHEPNVVRGPANEWIMFWTGCDPEVPGAWAINRL
jgi:hypothetical protein